MGRPPHFARPQLLEATMELLAEKGVGGATMAAIGSRLGAPIGSIYHRYPSRELLLADMWLELVERFQPGFLAPLLDRQLDPLDAAETAIRFVATWIARHPLESRVLLLHRREDLLAGGWPAQVRARARRLERAATGALGAFARRCSGRCGPAELRLARFAVVDLPRAVFRPAVEAGRPPSGQEIELTTSAARFALAAGASGHEGRSGRGSGGSAEPSRRRSPRPGPDPGRRKENRWTSRQR